MDRPESVPPAMPRLAAATATGRGRKRVAGGWLERNKPKPNGRD